MNSWLRLDVPVERLPDLVVSAQPDGHGGWHVRDDRTRGDARAVIMGFLTMQVPEYSVQGD